MDLHPPPVCVVLVVLSFFSRTSSRSSSRGFKEHGATSRFFDSWFSLCFLFLFFLGRGGVCFGFLKSENLTASATASVPTWPGPALAPAPATSPPPPGWAALKGKPPGIPEFRGCLVLGRFQGKSHVSFWRVRPLFEGNHNEHHVFLRFCGLGKLQ